ncbi:MAG: AAA family ATPase [Porphyromonadaceae bacterium]|nr:AAA family ATPase [Porphyromonadaceae bacterium]
MNKSRLGKITLQGYQSISFDRPVTLELGAVNILLGANGAGKSNIIGFFNLLQKMMEGSLQLYIAKSGTNRKFLHYGPKKTPKISTSIQLDSDDFCNTYKFCLSAALPNRLIISSEKVENCNKNNGQSHIVLPLSDFHESALKGSTDEVYKTVWNFLSQCKVYQFSDSSISSPMRQASSVDSAHYLQQDAGNLASFLYYLKNNYIDSYNRIVNYVQGVVPQFKDFYLEPEHGYVSLKWIDTSLNDYVLSVDQFSDGSIRFISLATLLLQPASTMPSVIIIDEPELGLHPYAIYQLAEMIKDASLHVQVILATQSPSLVNEFDLDDVFVVERDEDNQCTEVKKLKGEDYKEWLEEYTFSELWDKNVIGGRPV